MEVDVLFNPEEPTDAEIMGYQMWLFPIAGLVAGVGTLAFAALLLALGSR